MDRKLVRIWLRRIDIEKNDEKGSIRRMRGEGGKICRINGIRWGVGVGFWIIFIIGICDDGDWSRGGICREGLVWFRIKILWWKWMVWRDLKSIGNNGEIRKGGKMERF